MLTLKEILAIQKMKKAVGVSPNEGSCFGVTDARELRQPSLVECMCLEECDCQNPPPDDWDGKNGVYHISNSCPIHNLNPHPNPDCPRHG